MTDSSATVFVTTHDLELGLARRDCPTCQMPLLIRLPSMQAAINDQDSESLKLGLDDLNPSERRVFDSVYRHYPRAVTVELVMAPLHVTAHSFDQYVRRLRKKIEPRGWRMIRRHSTLRLVEPQQPEG